MASKRISARIALAGNPNVGKSTIFNALTNNHRHTGNWTGKSVDSAAGEYVYNNARYEIIDIPGAYSLFARSRDEEVASHVVLNSGADAVVVVCDATCLERNLFLAFEIMSVKDNVIICLNLMDEAKKKGVILNSERLASLLGVPVIECSARRAEGIGELMRAIEICTAEGYSPAPLRPDISGCTSYDEKAAILTRAAEDVSREVITQSADLRFDRRLDKIIMSRAAGYPIMAAMLLLIFWITIEGANYPSELLSLAFTRLGVILNDACLAAGFPEVIRAPLIDGIYNVLTWVISVMLPPMAIFFPLFSLLEDAGFLPRIAFNLDSCFKRACACGKQSLTM